LGVVALRSFGSGDVPLFGLFAIFDFFDAGFFVASCFDAGCALLWTLKKIHWAHEETAGDGWEHEGQ